MMKLYKLSFTDKAQWDNVKTSILLADEDGNIPNGTYTNNGMTVVEVGYVPIPATYDEDGEELTEATFNEDYAVDILTEKTLDLGQYIVKYHPENWYHGFSGVDIIPVIPTPDDSWLKADIKLWLDSYGIDYPSTATKAQLLELC